MTSNFSDKNIAVSVMVMARYLAAKDPSFHPFLMTSLDHARQAGLEEKDLEFLRTIAASIDRSMPRPAST